MSNKKQINIFIGIPGSGKSYYAHQYHHNDIYINADSLREQLTGDINNQEKNHFVFQHLEIMVEYFMRQGVSICIDNCNQMISRRKNWLSLGKKYGYKIYAVCFKTSLEECKKRNAARTRNVPEFVLDKMFNEFQDPTPEEGFDNIIYV